jgi:hypothetical protein
MCGINIHKKFSKDRTGFDFEELHRWIDEPYKDLKVNHRIKRHSYNNGEAEFIRKYWDKKRGKDGEIRQFVSGCSI